MLEEPGRAAHLPALPAELEPAVWRVAYPAAPVPAEFQGARGFRVVTERVAREPDPAGLACPEFLAWELGRVGPVACLGMVPAPAEFREFLAAVLWGAAFRVVQEYQGRRACRGIPAGLLELREVAMVPAGFRVFLERGWPAGQVGPSMAPGPAGLVLPVARSGRRALRMLPARARRVQAIPLGMERDRPSCRRRLRSIRFRALAPVEPRAERVTAVAPVGRRAERAWPVPRRRVGRPVEAQRRPARPSEPRGAVLRPPGPAAAWPAERREIRAVNRKAAVGSAFPPSTLVR